MKTKIFLLVVLFLPIFVWGQEDKMISYTSETIEVTPPEFTGIKNTALLFNGNNTMTIEKYIIDNFVYPNQALNCLNQGTIVVQFVVNENGELSDFNVINSVCQLIDKEFIKLLKTTDGMWKPGMNNGKPYEMDKEVSMMFVASLADKDMNAPREYLTKLARNCFVKANALFMEKHHLKRALNKYNECVKYLPYESSTLLVRGLCKYEMGDIDGARKDWERTNEIGVVDADDYINKLCYLKGYDEMLAILKE